MENTVRTVRALGQVVIREQPPAENSFPRLSGSLGAAHPRLTEHLQEYRNTGGQLRVQREKHNIFQNVSSEVEVASQLKRVFK